MESIDSLIQSIKESGVTFVIVSHNQHFIRNVTSKLWIISSKELRIYDGDFDQYKSEIMEKL